MEDERTIDFLLVREGIREFSLSALVGRGRIATMTNDWWWPRAVLKSITRCMRTHGQKRGRHERTDTPCAMGGPDREADR